MTYIRNDGNTSAKDEARTPMKIFDALNAEFHFDLDVACNRKNCLCNFGIFGDEGWDALEVDWTGLPRSSTVAWCNPPYSKGNILKFVHKAWLESGKGATVVLLIPSDASTEYFEFCFNTASEIRFMIPRVRFNNPDGTPFDGSPQTGSMIVVFRPGEWEGKTKYGIWRWNK